MMPGDQRWGLIPAKPGASGFSEDLVVHARQVLDGTSLLEVILYSHLLLEQALDLRIRARFEDPSVLVNPKLARLSFAQKVTVYAGLCTPDEDQVALLLAMNRLRDRAADTLADLDEATLKCLPGQFSTIPSVLDMSDGTALGRVQALFAWLVLALKAIRGMHRFDLSVAILDGLSVEDAADIIRFGRIVLLGDRSQMPDRSPGSAGTQTTGHQIKPPRRLAMSTPVRPEPVPEAQYEKALAVLRHARNALERSPSMTAHLGEEKIRDLLLLFLNGQFKGAAVGEMLNAAGKTDILVRANDHNVFIAECKIWKGPSAIRGALTQLLSYLTWRDTQTALLLFIRSGEPTTIISKAITAIEGHPNYKRTLYTSEDSGRYDFVMHANGDPDREIQLAFLPFALRDMQDQQ